MNIKTIKDSNKEPVCLITGTGMDSKTMTHFLIPKNYTIILTYRRNSLQDLDKLKSLFEEDLQNHPSSKLDMVFMDITDQNSVRQGIESVIKKYGKIDELYSFAAQSHVGDSFTNPLYTIQATGLSVFYLLETLRGISPITKFFQASSSEMFGGNADRCPFNEKSSFECRSSYAIAKLLGYNWVYFFRQTYGMFCCSAFGFNHSNYYRDRRFYCAKVVNAAAKISLGKQRRLKVGAIDHYRDEFFTDFGMEAMHKLINLDKPEDVVIATGRCNHGEDYLYQSFNYFNLDWKKYIEIDDSLKRPNDVFKLVGDSSKAQKLLNWQPDRISFKDHISLMCKYHHELESGLNPKRPDVFKLYP